MRRRYLQSLVERHFAPSFPALRPVEDLLVRVDDGIVRGFCFDRSQMNKHAVRLTAFAQALFVPSDHVALGIARGLGDYYFDVPERGGEVMEAMRQRALRDGPAFLALTADCRTLAEHSEEELRERVRRVAGALERSPEAARDVLDGWERETMRALGLEAA
jgi:hypothetical protein